MKYIDYMIDILVSKQDLEKYGEFQMVKSEGLSKSDLPDSGYGNSLKVDD